MGKIVAIIIALIIIIGGAVAITHKNNNSNSSSYSTNTNQQTQPSQSSQNASTGKIDIKNMAFTPSQITIAKGGTVTWTNNDTTTHTVIDDLANVNGPHSGDIAPGQTYSFTFNQTGSFQYHCNIHPSMRGTIVVK